MTFTLLLQIISPSPPDTCALYAISLPRTPVTPAGGGARLRGAEYRTARMDPHGLVRFTADARETSIQEPSSGTQEVWNSIKSVTHSFKHYRS